MGFFLSSGLYGKVGLSASAMSQQLYCNAHIFILSLFVVMTSFLHYLHGDLWIKIFCY